MKQLTAEQRSVYKKKYEEFCGTPNSIYYVLALDSWLSHYILSDSETFDSLEEWVKKLRKVKGETLKKIINGEK